MEIMNGVVINEVYPDLESVLNSKGQCIGVVVKSRKYPWKAMFFAYDDARFYYAMSAVEAVQAYLASRGDVNV